MESIRLGRRPVASFYLPDALCVPDTVFALEPQDSRSEDAREGHGSRTDGLILCVLQVS